MIWPRLNMARLCLPISLDVGRDFVWCKEISRFNFMLLLLHLVWILDKLHLFVALRRQLRWWMIRFNWGLKNLSIMELTEVNCTYILTYLLNVPPTYQLKKSSSVGEINSRSKEIKERYFTFYCYYLTLDNQDFLLH